MLIGVASIWHKLHGLELVGTISAIASGWLIAGWVVYANRTTQRVTATKVASGPVLYHADHGYFTQEADPRSKLAFILEVTNEPSSKRKRQRSGRIRAKLTYKLGDWVCAISPGTWVGEFFSYVDMEPGDTRRLIVVLCFYYPVDWRVVVNRRGNSAEAVSTNFSEMLPVFRGGTIEVDLFSCESGKVIKELEMGWRWSDDSAGATSPNITFLRPR